LFLVTAFEGVPLGAALGTLILEGLFDMFTTATFFVGLSALVSIPWDIRQWGYVFLVLTSVLAGALALLRWQQNRIIGLVFDPDSCESKQCLENGLKSCFAALGVFARADTLRAALGWSVFLWAVRAAVYQVGS